MRTAHPDLGRLADPIIAITTAPGRGAVGIVRLSGRDLSDVIAAVCRRRLAPRHATYGPFFDAAGEPIDQGLALHFPAPQSSTGEDVLELQAHGGAVVLQLLLRRCLQAGAHIRLRLAQPGEFSERAFLNGKLDLAQAEAVADLIDASTEAAARSAGRALAGAFSRRVDELAERLLQLRMLVEATLDFPEEEIDFLKQAGARARLAEALVALDGLTAGARQGALLRDGMRVVLAGQPNVGKSSLLNALAGAELAIVTAIPGTTRDRVAETIQIEGVPVHVIDTAGLRGDAAVGDEVERIGIGRSWAAIADADAVLFLHDLTRLEDPAYAAAETTIAARLTGEVLHVYNKLDAASSASLADDAIALSALTGAGLDRLRAELLRRAGWQPSTDGVILARARHLQALAQAREHLLAAQALTDQRDGALDLLAEELRLAHRALGEITGQVTADDLLGAIFSRFCIGK